MKAIYLTLLAFFLPVVAFAAPENFAAAVNMFIEILKIINPMILTLALMVFIWGLAKFILAAGDTNEIENGKKLMIWGLTGLFVMVSYLAILAFLGKDFGFAIPRIPALFPTN
ncbi:hypothetical protein KW783_00925 [Candidatus Parcubacteria bacterium]|nr:hypothetical protein [Candidatus Parcubacteria bacterium]